MRLLLTLLLASIYLQAASDGFWTLSGLKKSNVYVNNQLSTLKPSTLKNIKSTMTKRLEKNGIKTAQQDSPTLVLQLQELEGEESHFIYIRLALAEEVETFRPNRDRTFALTYSANDFIEAEDDEVDALVLESLDALLKEFETLYVDDNEE